MKHPLAYKSSGVIAVFCIAAIVCLLSTILTVYLLISGGSSDGRLFIYMVGFAFMTLMSLGFFIWGLITPNVLMTYDEKGIYFYDYHKKETFAAYGDIVNVEGRPVYARYAYHYNYGRMRIITKSGDVIVHWVSNLKDVTERIITLKVSAQDDKNRKQEHFVD